MIYDDTVRPWTPERNAIGHTHVRFKQTCVGSNGILKCKILYKNEHPTFVVRVCDVDVAAIICTDCNQLVVEAQPQLFNLLPSLRFPNRSVWVANHPHRTRWIETTNLRPPQVVLCKVVGVRVRVRVRFRDRIMLRVKVRAG
jgi:hypothetical protein